MIVDTFVVVSAVEGVAGSANEVDERLGEELVDVVRAYLVGTG